MRNSKKGHFVFIYFIFHSFFIFSLSNDFTFYKKIKIIDPNAELKSIDECLFTADDNIFIRGGSNVYKLNKNGELVANIIRDGLGPSEMSMLSKLNLNKKGDSLVLFDPERNKITLFDLNGNYLRTMDPTIQKRPLFLTSNNQGDYYLYFRDKKSNCILYHLNKDFHPLKCFYPNDDIHYVRFAWPFFNIDYDAKLNLYIVYPMDYIINVYDKEGVFLKSFAEPGEFYQKADNSKLILTDRNSFNKWYTSISPVFPLYVLENRNLIVFYQTSRKNSPKYYDLYKLDGRKVSSGMLGEDVWPIGKDEHGRLVCVKTEISADGTDVTYWLYIYELKPGLMK